MADVVRLFPQFEHISSLDDFELSVVVHGTSGLRPDRDMRGVAARLHFVNRDTGNYVQVPVARRGKRGKRKSRRKPEEDEDAEESSDSSDGGGGGGVTEPLRIKTKRKEPGAVKSRERPEAGAGLDVTWEMERLVHGDKYARFLTPDTVVLVEIVDRKRWQGTPNPAAGGEDTVLLRLAWGFLPLVNDSTGRSMTDRRTAVQLYKFDKKKRITVDDFTDSAYDGMPPFVYSLYRRHFLRAGAAKNAQPGKRNLFGPSLGGPPSLRPYRGTVEITVRGRVSTERLTKVAGASSDPGGDTLAAINRRREEEAALGGAPRKKNEAKAGPTPKPKRHVQAPSPGSQQRQQFALEADHLIDPGPRGCYAVQFSPDGRYLAAACADALLFPIRVYDVQTGKLEHEFVGHHDLTFEVNWSHDGEEILSASNDGTAKVWSWQQRPKADPVTSFQHPAFVFSARFCPIDRAWAVTGSFDGAVRIWDCVATNRQMMFEVNASSNVDAITSVEFDKSGTKVYSVDGNGEIRVWAVKREEARKPDQSMHAAMFKTLNATDVEQMAARPGNTSKLVLVCLQIIDEFRGSPVSALSLLRQDGRELFVQQRGATPRMCLFDARFFRETAPFALDELPGGIGRFVNKEWPLRAGVSPVLRGAPPAPQATGTDRVTSGVLVLAGSETGHLVLFSSATKVAICCFLASDLGLHDATPPSCVAWNPKNPEQVAVCAFGMEQSIAIAKLELPDNISDALHGRFAQPRMAGVVDSLMSTIRTNGTLIGANGELMATATATTATDYVSSSAPPSKLLNTDANRSPPLSPRSNAKKNALARLDNPALNATDRYAPEERLSRFASLPRPGMMPVDTQQSAAGDKPFTARDAYASLPAHRFSGQDSLASTGAGWDASNFRSMGGASMLGGGGGGETLPRENEESEEFRRKQRKYRKKRREAMLSRIHTIEAYERQGEHESD